MIRTMEIPKRQWGTFLRMVEERGMDRPVRIEVEKIELGDQELARMKPLLGIELEEKGSDRGNLVIMMGDRNREVFDHRINDAVRMYAGINEASEMEWLAIEEPEGAKTIVYFEHLPMLDAGLGEEPGAHV